MRIVPVLLLLLVACGGASDPRQSDVVKTLSGTWQMSTGGTMVFDFDTNQVFIGPIPAQLEIDRVEGNSLYLKGPGTGAVQVRVIDDTAAEWNVGKDNAILLTRTATP